MIPYPTSDAEESDIKVVSIPFSRFDVDVVEFVPVDEASLLQDTDSLEP